MSLLRVENMSHEFDGGILVKNVNFTVNAGECAVLEGDVGSGKTAFMKLISGLLEPSQGKVYYQRKLFSYSLDQSFFDQRADISYMLEGLQAQENLTLYENLALPYRAGANYSEEQIYSIVQERLALMNMDHKADWRPSRLSMEERNLLAIMMTFKEKNSLIVIDEIFTQLNHVLGFLLRDFLLERMDLSNIGLILCKEDNDVLGLKPDKVLRLSNQKIEVVKNDKKEQIGGR